MGQRCSGGATVLLVLAWVAFLPPAQLQAKEADAGAFLQALSRDATAELGRADLSAAEKEAAFRQLFRSAFDVPAISRFVLGKYWRGASDDQRQDFMAAFEDLHMRRFLPLIAKYDASALQVEGVLAEENKDNLFKVKSRIIQNEGEPIMVVWRVRGSGGSYKVLDVIAEGVSMAISLRHEYGSVVKDRGLDGLIQNMRTKSAELELE